MPAAIPLCLMLIMLGPSPQNRAILHVDEAATGAIHDGSTWCEAFLSLDDALAAAGSGDTIRLADGTYVPSQRSEAEVPRTETFELAGGITLEGGYAGCGAPDPDERDPVLYETTLSGDLDGNDPDTWYWDDPLRHENALHVATCASAGSTIVLDGLTITGGRADHIILHDIGGGLLILDGQVQLNTCTFTRNYAVYGGSIGDEGNHLDVTECQFFENRGEEGGGGLYTFGGQLALTGCGFTDNESGAYGAGVLVLDASLTATNCIFEDNLAGTGGAGLYVNATDGALSNCSFLENTASRGGAIYDLLNDLDLTDCTFTDNTGHESGGAIYSASFSNLALTDCYFSLNSSQTRSGAVNIGDRSNGEFTRCHFVDNTSDLGGALSNLASSVSVFSDCIFANNAALDRSGGAMDNAGYALLDNCVFLENLATDRHGGAIYNTSDDLYLHHCQLTGNVAFLGGGLYSWQADVELVNCEIEGNLAANGAGMQFHESRPLMIGCRIAKNVATDSAGGVLFGAGSEPLMLECTIESNIATNDAGGIRLSGSDGTLIGCTVYGNSTQLQGGGVYATSSQSTFVNCLLVGNVAGTHGGGVYNIYSTVNLRDCILASNEAGLAGGGIFSSLSSNPEVTNSIIWANAAPEGPQVFDNAGGSAVISFSCVQGGRAGLGNIGELPEHDPLFLRLPDPGQDSTWGTDDDDPGNLRLSAGSPCIDAGRNGVVPPDILDLDEDGDTAEPVPVDADGNPRFVDDPSTADTGLGDPPLVDMGSYEFQLTSPCPWDLDGDGLVNPFDANFVLARFGCEVGQGDPDCDRADLDGDGVVNPFDANAVLANFGVCP